MDCLIRSVHPSRGCELARGALLLLELRHPAGRPPIHQQRGTPLLHELLQPQVRQGQSRSAPLLSRYMPPSVYDTIIISALAGILSKFQNVYFFQYNS